LLTDKAEELNPRLFSFSHRNFAEVVNPVNNLRAPQTDLKIVRSRPDRAKSSATLKFSVFGVLQFNSQDYSLRILLGERGER
jgi:hypothetical protein